MARLLVAWRNIRHHGRLSLFNVLSGRCFLDSRDNPVVQESVLGRRAVRCVRVDADKLTMMDQCRRQRRGEALTVYVEPSSAANESAGSSLATTDDSPLPRLTSPSA